MDDVTTIARAIPVETPERTDTIDTGTENPADIADSLMKRLISLAHILLTEQSTNVCVYILYCFSTSPNWALNLNRLGT